jgi:pSer/pThr/pTyr-binding forkhead associated (FHA) protein
MAEQPQAGSHDDMDPNATVFGLEAGVSPKAALPPDPATYLPVLVCLSGPEQGRKFTITTQETIIGRDAATAQFSINDDRISRRHVRILYKNVKSPEKMPVCYLDDLESRNGTFVNGTKASHHHLLHERDRILIGDTVLGFFMRDQDELRFS